MAKLLRGAHRAVHRLKCGAGLFAEVRLRVEIAAQDEGESGYIIRTTETYPLVEYKTRLYAAAAFGIAYAIERLPSKRRETVRCVTIDLIKDHPIDTNTLVVAEAAAHAVWNALAVTISDPPMLDVEALRFVFPAGLPDWA